jgi:DNA helicase-2/ATP-dependent DNA helicase PcrA
MLSLASFHRVLSKFRPGADDGQRLAIDAPKEHPLFIVAGPGSGKTTCLTLRILKLIFVDGVDPGGIVATTFTVKAAEELRSRILGWGFKFVDHLSSMKDIPPGVRRQVQGVDINQVWTGTLDSLSQQLLRDYRIPGEQPPILADEFVARTLLLRNGLLENRRDRDEAIDSWLFHFHGPNRFGYHLGTKTKLLQAAWDRRHHDLVDWHAYVNDVSSKPEGEKAAVDEAMESYSQALNERFMLDFTLLEYELLKRLRSNSLTDFTKRLEVLLVDEYQDTNSLQEQIYFELASQCGGALCVVGDDDQSLYRFRGATVELFRDFRDRYNDVFKSFPETVYLSKNYRSTDEIIDFVNRFIRQDASFQVVRVTGKPNIVGLGSKTGCMPVLGMFRETPEILARSLADFIDDVFCGKGRRIEDYGLVIRDAHDGDVGDCAFLTYSPAEFAEGGKERFPSLLRQSLLERENRVEVFNPRGERFSKLDEVTLLGGLLAECLDPDSRIQDHGTYLSDEARNTLCDWRQSALQRLKSSSLDKHLAAYVDAWRGRHSVSRRGNWPKRFPVIELIYALVHYQEKLYNDPEGQVYLEVFTRQLNACEQLSGFNGIVLTDPENEELASKSVRDLIRDFLAPIASDMIDVDEELVGTFPRDRLSILSIHQSKGLEFPLTIVDVGSEFRTNHAAQAFKRFPSTGSASHRMEDAMRPYSDLHSEARGVVDRAFDDLIRQYFVAFSRAQNVLLLVGLSSVAPGGKVKNIPTGWSRDGKRNWSVANPPLVLI